MGRRILFAVVISVLTLSAAYAIAEEKVDNNAISNVEAQNRITCIKNLVMLTTAKEIICVNENLGPGADVTMAEIVNPTLLTEEPICPSGGKYTLNGCGETPTCSIPGHEI